MQANDIRIHSLPAYDYGLALQVYFNVTCQHTWKIFAISAKGDKFCDSFVLSVQQTPF